MFNWRQDHSVDLDRYAELLAAARGSRSLREFAKLCNCSAAALTRIMHKQNAGPSRQKMLEQIAKNAAPDSGVTLKMLADANGYTVEKIGARWERQESPPTNQTAYAVHGILMQTLTDSGKRIQILPRNYQFSDYSDYVVVRPGLLVELRDESGQEELLYCDYLEGALMPFDVIDCIEKYTMYNALRYDGIAPLKFCLLLSKPQMYDEIVAEFGNKKMPIQFSLALVDVNGGTIARHHNFQRKKHAD